MFKNKKNLDQIYDSEQIKKEVNELIEANPQASRTEIRSILLKKRNDIKEAIKNTYLLRVKEFMDNESTIYNDLINDINTAYGEDLMSSYSKLSEKQKQMLKETRFLRSEEGKLDSIIKNDPVNTNVSKYMRKYISTDKAQSLYRGVVDRIRTECKKVDAYAGVTNGFGSSKEFYDWLYNKQDSFRFYDGPDEFKSKYSYQIDKDILGHGLKPTYSKDTCAFVPKYINSMFESRGTARGNLPLGVSNGREPGERVRRANPDIKYYSVYATVFGKSSHLLMVRSCTNMHEAFWIYKLCKEYSVRRTAALFFQYGFITREVYLALVNREVEDDSGLAKPNDNDKRDAEYYIERKELFNKIEAEIMKYTIPELERMSKYIVKIK